MATIKDDLAVLQTIFHPNVPFDEELQEEQGRQQAVEGDDSLQGREELLELAPFFLSLLLTLVTEGGFDPELLRQATHLEAQGIAAAEGGDLELALEKLDQAIQLLPTRASAFNNRAQALRLNGDVASKCTQGFIPRPLPPLVTMATLGLG
ncbi:hypothetical protein L345_01987, partial [Ophiophagus hannah]